MREIKFRAWDSRRKQMCYDVNVYSDSDGTWWAADWFGEDQQKISSFDANQDGSELMQFTGLKDKNGKEIWEGDIIGHIGYGVGVVKHSLDHDADYRRRNDLTDGFMSCWGMQEKKPHAVYFTSFCNWCRPYEFMEVIGNIYENPELLESPGA